MACLLYVISPLHQAVFPRRIFPSHVVDCPRRLVRPSKMKSTVIDVADQVGTDLKFTPQNGIPPYTLIISPTQHPPVNISSSAITSSQPQDHGVNYTIRYTHGQAFMVSLFDSNGSSWAAGPLHAGQALGGVECLAVRTGGVLVKTMKKGAAIGGIVGGTLGALVLGLMIGWLASALINKKKKKVSVPSLASMLCSFVNSTSHQLERPVNA